jgi:hypothetical protein
MPPEESSFAIIPPAPEDSKLPSIEGMTDDVSDADLERAREADEGDDRPLETRPDPDAPDDPDAPEDPDEPEDPDNAEVEGAEAKPVEEDAYTVAVKGEDGIEEQVTVGDLKAKYVEFKQLQDYAGRLHAEYEQVGFKAHQAVEAERGKYMQALDKFNEWVMTVVTPEFKNLDMAALADSDPAQYIRVKNRIDTINSVLQGIQQEQQAQAAAATTEGQKARAIAAQQSRAILAKAVPGWNDQVYSAVLTTAMKSYGFNQNEIGQVIDPRVIKMAHDAHLYQKLQSGKDVAAKKVAAAPVRTAKPGQGRLQTSKGGKVAQARLQFQKSRSDKDAVQLLMSKGIA